MVIMRMTATAMLVLATSDYGDHGPFSRLRTVRSILVNICTDSYCSMDIGLYGYR